MLINGKLFAVLETAFIIVLLVFLKTNLFDNGVKELFIMGKINEFGLMSLTQVILSPELRKEAIHLINLTFLQNF